jgi:hypothetical protein
MNQKAAGIFVSRAGIPDDEGERHAQLESVVRDGCLPPRADD